MRSRVGVAEGVWREVCGCVRVNMRCVWVAFVCRCFACDCVLELVCRVRFARVSCPWLRFGKLSAYHCKLFLYNASPKAHLASDRAAPTNAQRSVPQSAAAPFFSFRNRPRRGSRRCSRIHSYHSHLAFLERFVAMLLSPPKIIVENGFCFWETRRFAAYTWRFISTS